VTALDVSVYRNDASPELRRQAIYLLARNVPRMKAGYEELANNLRTDAVGAAFVASFMDWSRDVPVAGRSILDAEGYGMPPL
jgi:hypothetical protein